jgi:aerobic carbon-monoxide dehydrogenase small subunit
MTERTYTIKVEVNGQARSALVPARLTLVDLLRDQLRLTGTHVGCEHGICGACSVLLDGEPVRSCLMFAVQADGHRVMTVEGLGHADGTLSTLQDSFCETHAMQCGYCTSGMLIAAHALLQSNSDPTEAQIREALSGNLCRCTGYQQIAEAVHRAAEREREGKE